MFPISISVRCTGCCFISPIFGADIDCTAALANYFPTAAAYKQACNLVLCASNHWLSTVLQQSCAIDLTLLLENAVLHIVEGPRRKARFLTSYSIENAIAHPVRDKRLGFICWIHCTYLVGLGASADLRTWIQARNGSHSRYRQR